MSLGLSQCQQQRHPQAVQPGPLWVSASCAKISRLPSSFIFGECPLAFMASIHSSCWFTSASNLAFLLVWEPTGLSVAHKAFIVRFAENSRHLGHLFFVCWGAAEFPVQCFVDGHGALQRLSGFRREVARVIFDPNFGKMRRRQADNHLCS